MDSEEVEHTGDSDSHETEFNVIPVQLVESYEGVALTAPNTQNLTLVKGKYYKQTYRPAWEQMPDFKGWLRGVEGEPTRAYCTYCHKTLHAHRLSLLKHTCTIRHQKAAQIHASRKNKALVTLTCQQNQKIKNQDESELIKDSVSHEEDEDDEEGHSVAFVDQGEMEDEDTEQEDEEEGMESKIDDKNYDQNSPKQSSQVEKSPISTSVVDTSRGKAISGLQVSLYKLIDGRWTYINEGVTNSNGKFSHFLERCDFIPGRYKLHYDVDRYFESKKQPTLYPFIEIVFDSSLVTESYHIPLLLSPFGYSTYKGS